MTTSGGPDLGISPLPFHEDRSWSWSHGACLFIERAFFEALGSFDESYFLYMEDVDLGRRIADAGGEVVALDQRVMHHHGGRGARIGRARRRVLLDASRIAYGRAVYGRVFASLLPGSTAPAHLRGTIREHWR